MARFQFFPPDRRLTDRRLTDSVADLEILKGGFCWHIHSTAHRRRRCAEVRRGDQSARSAANFFKCSF